jgi:hypothetical protein
MELVVIADVEERGKLVAELGVVGDEVDILEIVEPGLLETVEEPDAVLLDELEVLNPFFVVEELRTVEL